MSIDQSIPYWRLSGFYFFYFALLGAWLPYWPLFLKSIDFSAREIGFLAGTIAATKIIAPNLWGWLADHYGHRMRIVRLGSLLALVIFLGIFIGRQFWWLVCVVAGFSFFWNAVLAQFEVITLQHLGEQYARYSQIRLWGSIGFIAAVAGLGLLFDWVAIGILPIILALMLAGIWLTSISIRDGREEPEPREREPLLTVLRRPSIIAFFSICFLMQLSHGPYYTFFSLYLEQYGYSRSATGLLWSLGVVAEVALFVVMHRLLQRFSLRAIMLWSLGLAAVRWLMIAFWVDSLLLLLLAQCLHAATFGSFHAYAIEVIRRVFGGQQKGQAMALYSALSFGAGGALGAVLSGLVWDISQSASFVTASAVCVLAMLIGWYFSRDGAYNRPA